MVAALGIAVVVAMFFYSSFSKNLAGVTGAFKTYGLWLHRAGGVSPHEHPWNFYFERLLFYRANGGPVWSEGLIAGLAAVGFAAGLAGRCLGPASVALVRIIAFYTVWMTLIYTALPYKTPWCMLGFWHGMILLAGVGAAALARMCKPPRLKVGMAVLLAAAAAQLGRQAWRESFAVDKGGVPYCDSAKSPHAYSQTAPDIFRLMRTVEGLARVSPAGHGTVIEVMSPDSYWPLPWYLRRFKAVGFWDKIPAQPPAPIMIVSTALRARFDEGPEKTHLMAGYFELRPNVFFELYVSADLWAGYIKTAPTEKD
jgi:predicted membrane-bound mannosyltransferase